MTSDPYLDAIEKIPRGQTRSFLELAALAGRPGAARAVGRAVNAVPKLSHIPVHRVVSANGRPKDASRLVELRHEGARPLEGEAILDWANRRSCRFVGHYASRELCAVADERVQSWNRQEVEAFDDEPSALARGFFRVGTSSGPEVPLPNRREVPAEMDPSPLSARLRAIDWVACRDALGTDGVFVLPALVAPSECAEILNDARRPERLERTIQMLPKGYGVGTYHYYREPVPSLVLSLRRHLYRELAPPELPRDLESFWRTCRAAGQERASSILICYGQGGINHPHRDVYGPVWFPYQALLMLSKRGRDFAGGQFFVEDEPAASRKEIGLSEGDVAVFASRYRMEGGRKVPLRHGMTTVTRGERYGLGIVFHLAE